MIEEPIIISRGESEKLPLFGYPEGWPPGSRSWRQFLVFRRPLGWLFRGATPRFKHVLHRCEHCKRRFSPWSYPVMWDGMPVFHRGCEMDPADGGYRVPRGGGWRRPIP